MSGIHTDSGGDWVSFNLTSGTFNWPSATTCRAYRDGRPALTGDFLVLDAESGDVLYRFNTGGWIGGGVVSYAVNGKQYIAVMSGKPSSFWIDDHSGAATAFVFALPD